MKKTIFGFAVILITIAACKKTATLPERFTPAPETNANLKLLYLAAYSPTANAPQVNFFANGVKISGAAATSTGAITGITYGSAFPSAVAYLSVPSGSVTLETRVIETATVMPGATLASSMLPLSAGKFYTYAVVDTITQASGVLVEDNLSVPNPDKAYFRVANFTADSSIIATVTKTSAPTGEFSYTKTTAPVAAKTVTDYDTLTAGNSQQYSITFKRASNGATLATAITAFGPSKAKKYTFYLGGLVRSSATLTRGFYTNN
jgi:hypothetical protein